MLLKPHIAILVPLVLCLRREWQALITGAVTVAVLIAVSTAIYGWQPWQDFLFRTSVVQAEMIDAGVMFYRLMSPSIATAALQYGATWQVALLAQVLVAIIAIRFVVKAARSNASMEQIALLVATATFLVLPYAFNYDLTVVMLGAIMTLARTDLDPIEERLAILGFCSPTIGMVMAAFSMPSMGLMLLGLAYVQSRAIDRDSRLIARRDVPADAGAARSA